MANMYLICMCLLRGIGTARWGRDRRSSEPRAMPILSRVSATALGFAVLLTGAGAAFAGLGQPTPWEMGMQDAASPVMRDVSGFNDFLFWVTTAIAVFVLVLLLVIMV